MKNIKQILIPRWILALAVLGTAGNAVPSLVADDDVSQCEGSAAITPALNAAPIGLSAIEDGHEDMDRFFKAKEFVFKRDWRAARAGFESYLQDFPAGRMRDEAHFWLAQSLNYLTRDEKGREAILRLKKAALREIQKLVDTHSGSLWRDDALAFRVEIAGELVLLGEESYQKYITEAVEAGNKSPRDLKLQALGALVNLDPGTALPVIRRTLQTDGDAVVRDRCLTLLLRLPDADAEGKPAAVTGVIADPPTNSTLQFDFVNSFQFIGDLTRYATHWGAFNFDTFVLLRTDADPEGMGPKITEIAAGNNSP